jgi:carbonic anhydrase/acetyltransferase-like protein (isoleucine patch superfamily)
MYTNPHNPLAWIRGIEKGNVNIGANVWIGPFCVIDGEYDKVEIGENVNVSSGAQIVTHDTVKRCLTGGLFPHVEHAPTKIGKNVYIGTNAVILKGCIVGDNCIIAAGAILKENSIIPPFSLVAGVPATVKKNIHNEFKTWNLNDTI